MIYRVKNERQFLVFAWSYGQEHGGFNDFVGSCIYLSGAIDFAKSKGPHWHIFDTETGRIVKTWEDDQ